jgi:hypothetical protein
MSFWRDLSEVLIVVNELIARFTNVSLVVIAELGEL